MGKSDANECNESSLSNCRVQLALSTKRDGVIFEKRYHITVSSIPFSNRRDAPYSFSNLRAPSIISSPHHLKDSKKSIISVYEFPYMGTLIYFNFPIFATWFRDTRCSQSQIGQNLCKSVKSVGQRKTQISSKKICEIPDRIGQRSASSAKSACLYPIDRAGICENL